MLRSEARRQTRCTSAQAPTFPTGLLRRRRRHWQGGSPRTGRRPVQTARAATARRSRHRIRLGRQRQREAGPAGARTSGDGLDSGPRQGRGPLPSRADNAPEQSDVTLAGLTTPTSPHLSLSRACANPVPHPPVENPSGKVQVPHGNCWAVYSRQWYLFVPSALNRCAKTPAPNGSCPILLVQTTTNPSSADDATSGSSLTHSEHALATN